MRRNAPILRGVFVKAFYVALAMAAAAVAMEASAQSLKPRVPGAQKSIAEMSAIKHEPVVILKFQEGLRVRMDAKGRFTGLRRAQRDALAKTLEGAEVKRLFSVPAKELDARRERAQEGSDAVLADLNLYYRVLLQGADDAPKRAAALGALKFVEYAEPMPAAPPPPQAQDLPPTTPDLTAAQGYLAKPPAGVNPVNPATHPGADGTGLRVVDVEYDWILDHEDLGIPQTNVLLPPGAQIDNIERTRREHGAKVLGILVAQDNGYGVTGIAPQAEAFVSPQQTDLGGLNLADAVMRAYGATQTGDVIVMENQEYVCGGLGLGPSEWRQDVFDAVSIATGEGRVVVSAAGNGAVLLDRPECNGLFDRSARDSGAIIVASVNSRDFQRRASSSWGRRIDAHAWGDSVATTGGYGDLFRAPGDARQDYNESFSDTSAATAIVAGAALAVQSRRKYCGMPMLSARAMRRLLTASGTAHPRLPGFGAQPGIGTQPNIAQALVDSGAFFLCVDAQPDNVFIVNATQGQAFPGASRTYTVTNLDPRPVRFWATAEHPKMTVAPRTAVIPANGAATVTVTVPSIPVVTDPAGSILGSLTFKAMLKPLAPTGPVAHRVPLAFVVAP